MRLSAPSVAQRQNATLRGAATLVTTMALLLSTSMLMLYLNHQIVFEQRISANQMRSSIAFEASEAGLQWAGEMLNATANGAADCQTKDVQAPSFRRQYLYTAWDETIASSPALRLDRTAFAGCHLSKNGWSCDCPKTPTPGPEQSSGDPSALTDTAPQPAFTAAFMETGTTDAVRVLVTGCAAISGPCTPSNASKADATSSVSVIFKMHALLRYLPFAALTCGDDCVLGDGDVLVNQDPTPGALLVHAGGKINDTPATRYQTVGGQPVGAAKIQGDASLLATTKEDPGCTRSQLFRIYFGLTLEEFSATPNTLVISKCQGAGDCDASVDAAYALGTRSFFFPDGYARSSRTSLGSELDPVLLVSAAAIDLPGSSPPARPAFFGLVFVNTSPALLPGGSVSLHGALLSCGLFNGAKNGAAQNRMEFDSPTLNRLRISTGLFLRIPGSWTDLCTASKEIPPTLVCSES